MMPSIPKQSDAIPAKATRPRIIAIANQKGGVGKSTTAVNLGTALAAVDKKVLIVDVDPQGNATTGLGIESQPGLLSVYEVLIENVPMKDVIVNTSIPGLSVAPSSVDLVGAELELIDFEERAFRLKHAFQQMEDVVDYVFRSWGATRPAYFSRAVG